MKGAGQPNTLRHRPRAPFVLVLAALAIIPAAGCKHTPAAQPRPVAKDEHPQPIAPPAAPAPATSPVQVPTQKPRYAVQVAAFNRRDSAESLASRLSEHFGLQTLVAPVESNGATLYRVRILVGTKEEADGVAATFLRTEKLKVWVVPL